MSASEVYSKFTAYHKAMEDIIGESNRYALHFLELSRIIVPYFIRRLVHTTFPLTRGELKCYPTLSGQWGMECK